MQDKPQQLLIVKIQQNNTIEYKKKSSVLQQLQLIPCINNLYAQVSPQKLIVTKQHILNISQGAHQQLLSKQSQIVKHQNYIIQATRDLQKSSINLSIAMPSLKQVQKRVALLRQQQVKTKQLKDRLEDLCQQTKCLSDSVQQSLKNKMNKVYGKS